MPCHQMIVNATKNEGPIKYSGLGFLFGVDGDGGQDAPIHFIKDTGIAVSSSQQRMEEKNPFDTVHVSKKMREAGLNHKMVARFNDLCYGFDPYDWPGLNRWYELVDHSLDACGTYKDILHSIQILNEPDNKFWREGREETNFMRDPLVQPQESQNSSTIGGICASCCFKPSADGEGGDRRSLYDDKVNWLWTQTFRRIKQRDPEYKINGPGYEFYCPWRDAKDQDRMRKFLKNAIATKTVPEYLSWHNLGPDPHDVPHCLRDFYRKLEDELKVPGRPLPIMIDEYGPGTGELCGVPGQMIKYMAEIERAHVDIGMMGIYGDGGLIGNTLRKNSNGQFETNGGFWILRWYHELQGNLIFTSPGHSREYNAFDGISAYDQQSNRIQIIFGGSDADADIVVQGLHQLNFGSPVRVRVETTRWDCREGCCAQDGGSIERGIHETYDKDFMVDQSGQIIVPVHRINKYDGYRITVSPRGVQYPIYPCFPKYEAEQSEIHGGQVHSGPHSFQASNGAYVAQIDNPDDHIRFKVQVQSRDCYKVNVRYSSGAGDSNHRVFVNDNEVQRINYRGTEAWGDQQMDYATVKVDLQEGDNTIKLQKGDGFAEIDFIELQQDVETNFEKANNVYGGGS